MSNYVTLFMVKELITLLTSERERQVELSIAKERNLKFIVT